MKKLLTGLFRLYLFSILLLFFFEAHARYLVPQLPSEEQKLVLQLMLTENTR